MEGRKEEEEEEVKRAMLKIEWCIWDLNDVGRKTREKDDVVSQNPFTGPSEWAHFLGLLFK